MTELEILLKLLAKMSTTYNDFRENGEERKSIFMAISISIAATHTSPVEKRYRSIRDMYTQDMDWLLKDHGHTLHPSSVSFIRAFRDQLRANETVYQVNATA